jgi:putative membrane protein
MRWFLQLDLRAARRPGFGAAGGDRVALVTAESREPLPRIKPEHYSWIQVRLALDRTLLAWVRTAASLIGFGFAIFHFFDVLNSTRGQGVAPPWRPYAARLLGVSMVGVGTLALVLSLVQYRAMLRFLGGDAFLEETGLAGVPRFRPGLLVTLALTVVGLITFVTLLLRLSF